MAELTDAQIDVALARGKTVRLAEPRALAVRYDPGTERVIVELTNGCSFAFPPRLAQGLEQATDDQLSRVELLGSGGGLHWEVLDVDLSLAGVFAGLFGTRSFVAQHAGRARSPVKAAAARVNGAKGGRPRKSA